MFRKFLLGSLAGLGLIAATVAPLEASPHYTHHRPEVHHPQFRPWQHRVFHNWGSANAWMCHQRECGFECYFEWHGPQCFIFYR